MALYFHNNKKKNHVIQQKKGQVLYEYSDT